jgi:hypothetical protein
MAADPAGSTRGARVAVALACAAMLGTGCADEAGPTAPTPPAAGARLSFVQHVPPAGATIVVREGQPPGAFIPRGSGDLRVDLLIESHRTVPWAQLNVYLAAPDGLFCGQNLPDSPGWRPLRAGDRVSVSVTGFQIFRLPCDVTAIQAVLHTRDNPHLNMPILPAETLAEANATMGYRLLPGMPAR